MSGRKVRRVLGRTILLRFSHDHEDVLGELLITLRGEARIGRDGVPATGRREYQLRRMPTQVPVF